MLKETVKQGNAPAQSISVTRMAIKMRVGRIHQHLNAKRGALMFKHIPPNTAASHQQAEMTYWETYSHYPPV